MKSRHFFKDVDEPIRVFVSPLDQNHHDGRYQVKNPERYFCVGLEEKFPVDVRDEGVYELAEDLHEHLVAEVEADLIGVAEMNSKQLCEVIESQFSQDLEGLVNVKGFDEARDIVEVLEEAFRGTRVQFGGDEGVDLVDVADGV